MRGLKQRLVSACVAVAVSVSALVGAVVVASVAAPPQAGAAGSGVLIPWAPQSENPDSNKAPVPPAQAMQDALNFNVITAHVIAYAGQVPAMKAVNSNLKVLAYMNATFAQSYEGSTWAKKDYALDAAGHRIINVKSHNFLMDPSQQDWINTRVKQCQDNITQSGYDGCFLDLLGPAPLTQGFVSAVPINPATHRVWTRGQWLAATANLAAAVRAAAHTMTVWAHPALVFGNGLANGQQFYESNGPTSVLAGSLDGAIAEAWLRTQQSPAGYYPGRSQWLQNIKMVGQLETLGIPLLTITKMWVPATSAQQDAWRQYALASYLIATQGQSSFFFSTSFRISRTTPHPWYATALGSPLGAYSYSTAWGVYQRSFAAGLVLVNADTKAHTFSLGATYYTLSRQPVTSLTMNPNTGSILTTS